MRFRPQWLRLTLQSVPSVVWAMLERDADEGSPSFVRVRDTVRAYDYVIAVSTEPFTFARVPLFLTPVAVRPHIQILRVTK